MRQTAQRQEAQGSEVHAAHAAVLSGPPQASAAGGGGSGHRQRPGQPAGHLHDPPGGQQPGDGGLETLLRRCSLTAAIYGVGVLAALGYTQTMVQAAQKVLFDIRRDLFAHLQTLPLRFFDTQRHGDVMSYFTNDVDTISDALNNSFAMVIQSFIQMVGTLTLLFVLNWRLTLIVAVCYRPCSSTSATAAGAARSITAAAGLPGRAGRLHRGDGGRPEGGQGLQPRGGEPGGLRRRNEALRQAGTGAQAYAATMIPAVVSISYVNYAIVAVLGGYHGPAGPDGRGQPCQLPGVCPPGRHAHQPVHPAGQLPAGGPGRGRARL